MDPLPNETTLIRFGISWHSKIRRDPQNEQTGTDPSWKVLLIGGSTARAAFVTDGGTVGATGNNRSNTKSDAKGNGVPFNS